MKHSLYTFICALAVIAAATMVAGCGGTSEEKLSDSQKRAAEQRKLTEEPGEETPTTPTETTTVKTTKTVKTVKTTTTTPAEDPKEDPKEDAKGDVENGKGLFVSSCGGCHALGDAGTAGAVGPKLDGLGWDFDKMLNQIIKGKGAMPGGLATGDDADDIAAYVVSVTAK